MARANSPAAPGLDDRQGWCTIREKQSKLTRQAIDDLIDRAGRHRRNAMSRQAAGLRRDRTDLPDFKALRAEWDRTHLEKLKTVDDHDPA